MDGYREQYVNFLKTQFAVTSYDLIDNNVLLFGVTLLMDIRCDGGKIMKKGDKIEQICIPIVFHFETIEGENIGTYSK